MLLLCALINLALAIYVFHRRHSRSLHYVFASFVFGIALWNLTNFAITLSFDPVMVRLFGHLAFAAGAVLATEFLVFTWFFPEGHLSLPPRPVRVAVGAACCAVTLLCFTTMVQASVVITPTGKHPVFGPLFPLYVTYMVGLFGWGSWNLFRARIQAAGGRERMQLNYVFAAFGLAIVGIYIGQFALIFFFHTSDVSLLSGAVSSLTWVSLSSYAIVRHRLMDIGIALRNTLVHGLLSLVIAVLVLIPFALGMYVLPGLSELSLLISVLPVSIVLALMLPLLQKRITHFVDHRLFRGRYDHHSALVKFSERFLRPQERESIARTIARELPIILQAGSCVVYLPAQDNSGDSLLFAAEGLDVSPPKRIAADHPLAQEMVRRGRHLIREDIAYAIVHVDNAAEVLRLLNEVHGAVAFPLLCQGRMLGMAFLGEKQNDNVYTTDDLQLLNALSSQAAFAIDNTQLYEQALQAKKQYETILRHMQRGVLATDPRLQIVTFNQTAAELLGVNADEWLGRPVTELVPAFAEILETTLEKRTNLPLTELAVQSTRGKFPCECETSIMIDAQDRVIGATAVFQDLTERKRFEEEVRRMDRLASVGTLAAGIAHEIKNPLVSIQTFAQLLPERFDETDFRENFGNVVRSEIGRINRLVHSLLDFARPRRRQPGQVDIQELLERALTLLESQLKKQEIEIIRKYADDMPLIFADPEQIYQVFFNLLQNAVQAMDGPRRQITLSTVKSVSGTGQKAKDVVLLIIKDTGRGIEKSELSNIFDPFYSTKADGSGLGLSICHSILKEHGAGIDVQSSVGKGTTFTLTLPVGSVKRSVHKLS
jgi:PAS domain S-box-containing protein